MNLKILQEKENSLLKRKEILAEVDSPDKTPSNQELKKELAVFLKTKENLIVIKQINQIFGKRTSKVSVYIYKDEKSLKEIEPQPKEKEVKPKEGEPAKVEAPKETPKEQPKPAEQPKPEAPKEEVAEEEEEEATIETTVQEFFEGGFKAKDFCRLRVFDGIKDDEKINAVLRYLSKKHYDGNCSRIISEMRRRHSELNWDETMFPMIDIGNRLASIGLANYTRGHAKGNPRENTLEITKLGIIYVKGIY